MNLVLPSIHAAPRVLAVSPSGLLRFLYGWEFVSEWDLRK